MVSEFTDPISPSLKRKVTNEPPDKNFVNSLPNERVMCKKAITPILPYEMHDRPKGHPRRPKKRAQLNVASLSHSKVGHVL